MKTEFRNIDAKRTTSYGRYIFSYEFWDESIGDFVTVQIESNNSSWYDAITDMKRDEIEPEREDEVFEEIQMCLDAILATKEVV